STKANTEKSAKTGDSTAVPAAGMTVLLSGCALALLAKKRRKEM
ncbi:LPXTG cell wall anchor domain-containing protein, partial [Lachnoclostridium sp. An181]